MPSDAVFFVARVGYFGACHVVFHVGEVAAQVEHGRGLS
jgi:hypothetical protein